MLSQLAAQKRYLILPRFETFRFRLLSSQFSSFCANEIQIGVGLVAPRMLREIQAISFEQSWHIIL